MRYNFVVRFCTKKNRIGTTATWYFVNKSKTVWVSGFELFLFYLHDEMLPKVSLKQTVTVTPVVHCAQYVSIVAFGVSLYGNIMATLKVL